MPRPDNAEFSLKLILMRHAKSDWSDGSMSDHDRPLNQRGQRDTPRMAIWLAEQDCVPEGVLCSTAQRTRQTVQLLGDSWENDLPVSFCDSLYLGSPESIFQTICSEGGDAACLLVVAHNPGMSQLASAMANQALEMPTASVAVFEVDVESWQLFGADTSLQLVQFMRPKSL
ncbi:SixA phosphatase family protein [Planctomycetes bacterium K23_9]|uniref:Phosphohistidine phosphatase n=1 Tax=Stieleria marina TaxID=1930275 RepID=A0A517NLZ2_9BACT|nr:phosphohistidine phosphatase [Planctomycetes bacterium K23_9]